MASHGLQQCRKEKSERLRDPEITNVRAGRSLPRHHLTSSVQMRSRAREGGKLSEVTSEAGAGPRSWLQGLQILATTGPAPSTWVCRGSWEEPCSLLAPPDWLSVDSQVLGLGASPDENRLETFSPAGG